MNMRTGLSPLLAMLLALALIPAAACGSKSPGQAQDADEAGEATADETPLAETTPEPSAEAASGEAGEKDDEGGEGEEAKRKKLVDETLAGLPEVQRLLGELRGQPFTTEVPGAYQSQADFRAFVQAELDKEFPADKSAGISRALHHVGVLKDKIELRKTLEDAFVSQAGAYYDPAQKKFFVVMVSPSKLIMDTIAAHELGHALQDQRFDLPAYYGAKDGGKSTLTEDAAHARQFIVEGEATLLMTMYAPYKMTGKHPLDGPTRNMMAAQLRQLGSMDTAKLLESNKQQADVFLNMGDDIKKSVEAIDSIPPYVIIPLLEAYARGSIPVLEAYLAGGWDAVDALYAHPPESTEQVLHPVEKLLGKRDYPVELTLPKNIAPKGYSELHSDVLGELVWRVYLNLWEVDNANAASAGWDGDRVAVYGTDTDTLGIIATTWDSEADASEFENAYLASLDKRFPGAGRAAARDYTSVPRGDGTYVFVSRKGSNVYILDGAGDDGPRRLKSLARTRAKKNPKDK